MCNHVHSMFKSEVVENNFVPPLFCFCWKYEYSRCDKDKIKSRTFYICLLRNYIFRTQTLVCLLWQQTQNISSTSYNYNKYLCKVASCHGEYYDNEVSSTLYKYLPQNIYKLRASLQ